MKNELEILEKILEIKTTIIDNPDDKIGNSVREALTQVLDWVLE